MSLTTDELRDIFESFVKEAETSSEKYILDKYAVLIKDYNKIYNMLSEAVLKGKVEETRITFYEMLKFKDMRDSGKLSEFDSEVKFGTHLGEKYVYPKLGKPSKKALDSTYNDLKNKRDDTDKNQTS